MTVSIRTCSACGAKKDKHALHRFVWAQEQPERDPGQRFSGRGAYCCQSEECLDRFMNQKKKWKRIFRL